MSFLEIRGLRKTFGAERAVNGVDLDLAAGARLAIVGPSGCGKTTLLRLIAGFEQPDAGSIVIDNETIAGAVRSVPAHRRRIGYLPQDGALFPHLRVADNIAFGLTTRGAAREKRIAALMELVALDPAMLKRWPHELSGGQQQRVALARALALRPRMMLLDEPFSALDTGLRAATRKAVTKVLEAANVATILVTHDQAEALSFSDQLAVMRAGRLAQVGRPMELYLQPADAPTAQFLGEAMILDAEIADGFARCALGRIAVDDTEQRGPARIMIRPEQLQITDSEGTGCTGTVAEIDYTGATAVIAVQLASDTVIVRSASRELPRVGDSVSLTVSGTAHVLAQA